MSDDKKYTFLELLDEYTHIIVPIIQRDYVQGRENEESSTVRKNLLADIKEVVEAQSSQAYLDLNFIYGKVIKSDNQNIFVPVDGQQRLTTLFLLHLFTYSDEDDKTQILKKFSYETRESSRAFLKLLVLHRREVFSAAVPSLEIEDSAWFVTRWKYDPTVQSVFIMVDAIKKTFNDKEQLKKRLDDKQNKTLFFHFLEMEQVGREDSLYIKLNSRGKPLSGFENLKAGILGQLRKVVKDINYIETFEQNLDGKWTDFFWKKYQNCADTKQDDFDLFYKNFFLVFFYNQSEYIVSKNVYDTNVSAINYSRITKEMIDTISYTLNFLHDKETVPTDKAFILESLNPNSVHSDKVFFHIVTQFIKEAKDIGAHYNSFQAWVRVLRNLILNSQIDDSDSFRKAINGINSVSNHWDDLESFLSKKGSISGFNGDQLKEEQIKASLLLSNDEFKVKILEAETHKYFSGQIRSALYLSRSDESEYSLVLFDEYWVKISSLFNDDIPKNGNLLRRALLTLGDYRMPNSTYLTLCQADPSINIHNSSLKDLFSSNSCFVKQLLDKLNFMSDESLEFQLLEMIDNSHVPLNNWRSCFIRDERLLEVGGCGFEGFRNKLFLRTTYDYNTECVVIIPNKNSRGYNYDVFLKAFSLMLHDKGIKYSFGGYEGLYGDRWLTIDTISARIRFANNQFIVFDVTGNEIFKTKSIDPLAEIMTYVIENYPLI